jgi:hypothetical protein
LAAPLASLAGKRISLTGPQTHVALSLLPGVGALLLSGIGTPGVYGVDVAIEQEVQNQYETHQRRSLQLVLDAGSQLFVVSAEGLEPSTP